MTSWAWDAAAAILALAALMVLVRPSGDGPQMITAATGALSDVVTFAVGG